MARKRHPDGITATRPLRKRVLGPGKPCGQYDVNGGPRTNVYLRRGRLIDEDGQDVTKLLHDHGITKRGER